MSDPVNLRTYDSLPSPSEAVEPQIPPRNSRWSFLGAAESLYNLLPSGHSLLFFPDPESYDFSEPEPVTANRSIVVLSPPPANSQEADDFGLASLYGTDDDEQTEAHHGTEAIAQSRNNDVDQAPCNIPDLQIQNCGQSSERDVNTEEAEGQAPKFFDNLVIGAGQAIAGSAKALFNAITDTSTCQKTMEIVSNVFKSTLKSIDLATTTSVQVHGNPVSPLPFVREVLENGIRLFAGIKEQKPTLQSIQDEFTALRPGLDERLNAIPRIPGQRPAERSLANNQTANAAHCANSAMLQEEEAEKAKFLKNISNFASFRFFHETIMGNRLVNPDGTSVDALTYYKPFMTATDPNQFFYAQYGFVGGICARICLPIIQWIIGLIFSSKAESLSGISALRARVGDFLQNEENVRQELRTFAETTSDYFYKLQTIHQQFANGDGGTLTLQDYVAQKLNEDLDTNGYSRESLYQGLNNRIVEVIDIKTNIPVIGWLLDKIISAFMIPVLRNMNILQSTLETGIGTMRANPAFDYKIRALIANKLQTLTEQLRERGSLPGAVQGLALTDQDKDVLKTLYTRLQTQLSLEGVLEENLPEALQPLQEPSRGFCERVLSCFGMAVDWNAEIAENLEGLFKDVFALFFQEFSQPDHRLSLWLEALKSANSLFENGATAYSSNDLQQIHDEVQMRTREFMDTILDMQFPDEFNKVHRDREHQKTRDLIHHTKEAIEQGSINLIAAREETQKPGCDDEPIELIEAKLYRLMHNLKEFFSVASNCISDFSQLEQKDKLMENRFAWEMHRLVKEMDKVKGIYDQSLAAIQQIKTHEYIKQTTASLLPSSEEDDTDFDSIIPGIPLDQIIASLSTISSELASQPQDPQRHPLQAFISDLHKAAQSIDLTNKQLAEHTRFHTLFENLKEKLEELAEQVSEEQPQNAQPVTASLLGEARQTLQELMEYRRKTNAPEFESEAGVAAFLTSFPLSSSSPEQRLNAHGRLDRLIHMLAEKTVHLSQAFTDCIDTRKIQRTNFNQQINLFNNAVSACIDHCRERIHQENVQLENSTAIMNSAQENIQGLRLISLDFFSKSIAARQKSNMNECTNNMLSKFYSIFTNPKHIEQLFLRGFLMRLERESQRG